jgi:hypothetical protein
VTKRHLMRRVLSGVPRALYEKLRRRIGRADVKADHNYAKPVNLEDVLKSIPLEMQSIFCSCESKTPDLDLH